MVNKGFKRVNLLQGNKRSELPQPYGYSKDFQVEEGGSTEDKKKTEILLEQAWALATSPFKTILMNGFFMWMTGNSLSIFPLIFLFSIMYSTIKTLSGTSEAFKKFNGLKGDILFYKAIYFGINLIALGMGLYKLYNMGLLPLHPADYVDLVPFMKVILN
jgi:hypothetical protein